MRIAVLTTCHNRREMTLRCLRSLEWQSRGVECAIEVFLVDDGSTDGTGESVRSLSAEWPAERFSVCLIRGNGFLYWAKGMECAWRVASKVGYDGYLWLNDDVDLMPDAIKTLLRSCASVPSAVIVGEVKNSRGAIIYGKRGDLFTGNFVYVPRAVYEKVGIICGQYHHAWADSDYALRCKRLGVEIESCGVVGQCEGHPNRPGLKGLSLCERWSMLWNPKGWSVHDLWLYRLRNRGVCAAIFSCLHLVWHVLKGVR